ncbi:HD domain-containing protein [Patescibacteria group bacterium]|nr:HD domain-containing protein [Patescibacteria group bacterium]MBU1500816.1 HD domain-containing protein [Patescibacteria group bacterium]MBU2080871.1 HD domain-containing protein [Patescibacteria group bacterium]MBU2123976.1 HD domain-containing protein [Patescibacteria group bacterium]MBU2194733.1 HD domain-containing protein [Patescibacteria group bacterium]
MTTVKEILAQVQTPSPEDTALIEKAYEFAKKAHEGHTRYSGEPYFIHPAAVAKHLAELGMDSRTIAAALLHDAIEDAMATPEEVESLFGSEVLFLVEGVTKLGKHKYQGGERHAESLRRLLVATSADIRVLIIKLADRYHNMSTLEHVPEAKRKRIALETLEIFAPIADRLGMGSLKKELEDLAFPAIDPDAYQHAIEVRKLKKKETDVGLARVQKELQHALVRKGVQDFSTSIRMKGLWSLHQKLKRKGDDITRIHDIAALRVVVPTIDDCYTALGVIHANWKPLPGEFKDYISFPKPNGYQSLHTTVVTGEAGIVEMQVRTKDMHQRAQFGIASHMSYKALAKSAGKNAFQRISFPWIRDLVPGLLNLKKAPTHAPKGATNSPDVPQWLTELKEAHIEVGADEFVEGLKSDFFSHRIFVFTPIGDVIDLPTQSTPVDFAYAIHSDLGNHMQGAKVNGKLVSFDSQLGNGDIIEILKSKSAHPTTRWIEYARTSMARRHIRNALEAREKSMRTQDAKAKKKAKKSKQ